MPHRNPAHRSLRPQCEATATIRRKGREAHCDRNAWDQNKQKLTETRINVGFIDEATAVSDVFVQRGDAQTRYFYDVMGNQVSVFDAVGRQTISEYDAMGNVVSEFTANDSQARQDGEGNDIPHYLAGTLTRYARDINGNIISRTEYANGGRYVLERGQVMSNGQDTKHDRVTWSAYDSHNNVKAILDAEGHLSRTDFDAFGRAVRLRQVVSNSFFGTQEERVQVLQYDALGRQIDDATRAVAHTLDANEVRHFVHQRVSYNSFGEITGRNLVLTDSKTGIVLSNTSYEINRYDNAGNVIQTNQGDGVTKTLHYDVMGRVTAAIRNTNNADANGANSADFALCFATHR